MTIRYNEYKCINWTVNDRCSSLSILIYEIVAYSQNSLLHRHHKRGDELLHIPHQGLGITSIVRYGANEAGGDEGTVMQATFVLKGQEFMCIDSNIEHQFTFTPSFSIFVTCETEEEIDRLYEQLMEGGQALMPIGDYGFSKKFSWLNDKFGVSWQLNLPK